MDSDEHEVRTDDPVVLAQLAYVVGTLQAVMQRSLLFDDVETVFDLTGVPMPTLRFRVADVGFTLTINADG